MFSLSVVTEPTSEPLTEKEAREHLRFAGDYETDLILALVAAARRYCETYTGRAFITQTLRLTLDCFPANEILLPRPPLASVTNIQYTDSDGDTQTVDSSTYVVDAAAVPGRIALAYGEQWPTDAIEQIAAVRINYVAGYGDAADVPQTIKHAMRLLIEHWFIHRAAVDNVGKEVAFAVKALLNTEWCGTLAGTFA
jgi:uncharacterized phiE125 gp8 family phage protein